MGGGGRERKRQREGGGGRLKGGRGERGFKENGEMGRGREKERDIHRMRWREAERRRETD